MELCPADVRDVSARDMQQMPDRDSAGLARLPARRSTLPWHCPQDFTRHLAIVFDEGPGLPYAAATPWSSEI